MRKNQSWKDIEASRNARLWLTDVILPILTAAGGVVMAAQLSGHDIIGKAKQKFDETKTRVKAWKNEN